MAGSYPNRSSPSSLPLLPDFFLWGEETPGDFSTPGVSFHSSPFMIKFQMQSDSHCESDSHRLATVLWGRVPLGHGPSI